MEPYDLTEADFEEEMKILLASGPSKNKNEQKREVPLLTSAPFKQLWLVFQAGAVRFRVRANRPPKESWDITEHPTFDEARKAYNEL